MQRCDELRGHCLILQIADVSGAADERVNSRSVFADIIVERDTHQLVVSQLRQ